MPMRSSVPDVARRVRAGPRVRGSPYTVTPRRPAAPRGEILTFPDTLTTQGLSLWCFNIVAPPPAPGPDLTQRGRGRMVFLHLGIHTLFPTTPDFELSAESGEALEFCTFAQSCGMIAC